MSSSDIIPDIPPWSMPSIPSMPSVSTGSWPQAVSMEFMRLISGPWASMTFWANAATSAGTSSLASSISLISTACWWCGIIIWANITSASLCSAETSSAEPVAVVDGVAVAVAAGVAAGAELVAVAEASAPAFSSWAPVPQAVKVRAEARARAVSVMVRFMVGPSIVG